MGRSKRGIFGYGLFKRFNSPVVVFVVLTVKIELPAKIMIVSVRFHRSRAPESLLLLRCNRNVDIVDDVSCNLVL